MSDINQLQSRYGKLSVKRFWLRDLTHRISKSFQYDLSYDDEIKLKDIERTINLMLIDCESETERARQDLRYAESRKQGNDNE